MKIFSNPPFSFQPQKNVKSESESDLLATLSENLDAPTESESSSFDELLNKTLLQDQAKVPVAEDQLKTEAVELIEDENSVEEAPSEKVKSELDKIEVADTSAEPIVQTVQSASSESLKPFSSPVVTSNKEVKAVLKNYQVQANNELIFAKKPQSKEISPLELKALLQKAVTTPAPALKNTSHSGHGHQFSYEPVVANNPTFPMKLQKMTKDSKFGKDLHMGTVGQEGETSQPQAAQSFIPNASVTDSSQAASLVEPVHFVSEIPLATPAMEESRAEGVLKIGKTVGTEAPNSQQQVLLNKIQTIISENYHNRTPEYLEMEISHQDLGPVKISMSQKTQGLELNFQTSDSGAREALFQGKESTLRRTKESRC